MALKLNLPVVVLCALLPDIVDKPLSALGIGGGRYIAHTLLFVFVVAIAFSLWKRVYGLSALLGGVSHLLLDLGGFVLWFYPFASYDFPSQEFDPSGFFPNLFDYLQEIFTLSAVGKELIWVAAIWVATFLCLRLHSWFIKRRKQGA